MKTPRASFPFSRPQAMSLVEVLVVVTILGIFGMIAIQIMGSATRDAANASRDRHNAKNLVTVFQSGEAAGLDFYVEGDLAKTVSNIVTGSTASVGAFEGTYFSMQGLSAENQQTVLQYLRLENGALVYDPNYPGG